MNNPEPLKIFFKQHYGYSNWLVIINNEYYPIRSRTKTTIKLEEMFQDADMLEIITGPIGNADLWNFLTSFFNRDNKKQIFLKRLKNPYGFKTYGIILGVNLNTNKIPSEIKWKTIISRQEWDEKVMGNVFINE